MNNNLSITNNLAILSIIVSFLAFYNDSLYIFGINDTFFLEGKYYLVLLQFFLGNFIHGDFIHLLANLIILFLFGNILENLIGKNKFLIFFIVTSIFNGFAILIFSTGNTVGISGFCMALLSFTVLEMYKRKNPEYKSGIVLIFLNIAVGFIPGISLVGHFFGALIGIFYYFFNIYVIKKD